MRKIGTTLLVETEADLPALEGAYLYLDLETTSRDPTLMSVNPHHNCWIAGICIAVDDGPTYYIPVGHAHGRNVEAKQWLIDTMGRCGVWVNHNVKYDMHVLHNDYGYRFSGQVIDTIAMAKLYRSDLQSYSLDSLMRVLLPDYPGKAGQLLHPYLVNNKDYGRIPIDVLGEYGGHDVACTRVLFKFLSNMLPAECTELFKVENAVTKILFDTEVHGLLTNPALLKAMNIHYITELMRLEREIADVTGYDIRPHVNDDCYDLLCNGYNLPVLKYTNEDDDDADAVHNPSFSKDVLRQYLSIPGAPTEVVQRLLTYREMNTFRSLFLETYIRLHKNSILHPDYNQTVRTGRMSARRPNAQQLNKNAKKLIVPRPGCSFLSIDYSQIEFRLIVHYIQDKKAIDAYRRNPDTDFHTWVAEMCGIPRRPAKNVNFCMGYGGGRGKLIAMLSKEPTLVDAIKVVVEGLGLQPKEALSRFEQLAVAKAESVYDMYHNTLPTLKKTARAAEMAARRRGYVFNLFNRRRHLDNTKCHIAFNALNQSTAADIMKTRLARGVKPLCESLGLDIAAIVHDEVLIHGPTDVINQSVRAFIEVLEQPDVELLIPLRCSYGISDKSWYDAGLPELKLPLSESPWHATV